MSTDQDKLLPAIESLGLSNTWASIIGPTFDKMEVCESAIAKARRQYPAHDAALWNAFMLLIPSKLLHEAPEPVYRAHCAELLGRVRKGQDTRPGTKAEIMMALSRASLESPLVHVAAVLYAKLFREILPHIPVAAEIAHLSTLAYDGETKHLLGRLARNAGVPDRKPKKESEWRTPPE